MRPFYSAMLVTILLITSCHLLADDSFPVTQTNEQAYDFTENELDLMTSSTYALVSAVATYYVVTNALDNDSGDKTKHAALSAGIGGASMLATEDWKTSAMVCMGVGVTKELLDSRSGGTGFDTQDLVADGLGCAVGILTADTVIKGINVYSDEHGIYGISYSMKF